MYFALPPVLERVHHGQATCLDLLEGLSLFCEGKRAVHSLRRTFRLVVSDANKTQSGTSALKEQLLESESELLPDYRGFGALLENALLAESVYGEDSLELEALPPELQTKFQPFQDASMVLSLLEDASEVYSLDMDLPCALEFLSCASDFLSQGQLKELCEQKSAQAIFAIFEKTRAFRLKLSSQMLFALREQRELQGYALWALAAYGMAETPLLAEETALFEALFRKAELPAFSVFQRAGFVL